MRRRSILWQIVHAPTPTGERVLFLVVSVIVAVMWYCNER